MVLLPLIVLIAFQFDAGGDDDNGNGEFASLIDLATAGGLNFALFSHLRVGVLPAGRRGGAVLRRHGGQRGELGQPALPAGGAGAPGPAAGGEAGRGAGVLGAGPAAARRHRPARSAPCGTAGSRCRAPSPPQIPAGEGLLRLLGIVGYLAVALLVVAGLAFLLSVSTDAALGAVGGAVLLWILSSILDQIEALGVLRDFLPTHYSTAWLGLLSTPIQTDDIVRGCISAISYATDLLEPRLLAFHPQGRRELTIPITPAHVPVLRVAGWGVGHRGVGVLGWGGVHSWTIHLTERRVARARGGQGKVEAEPQVGDVAGPGVGGFMDHDREFGASSERNRRCDRGVGGRTMIVSSCLRSACRT